MTIPDSPEDDPTFQISGSLGMYLEMDQDWVTQLDGRVWDEGVWTDQWPSVRNQAPGPYELHDLSYRVARQDWHLIFREQQPTNVAVIIGRREQDIRMVLIPYVRENEEVGLVLDHWFLFVESEGSQFHTNRPEGERDPNFNVYYKQVDTLYEALDIVEYKNYRGFSSPQGILFSTNYLNTLFSRL